MRHSQRQPLAAAVAMCQSPRWVVVAKLRPARPHGDYLHARHAQGAITALVHGLALSAADSLRKGNCRFQVKPLDPQHRLAKYECLSHAGVCGRHRHQARRDRAAASGSTRAHNRADLLEPCHDVCHERFPPASIRQRPRKMVGQHRQ